MKLKIAHMKAFMLSIVLFTSTLLFGQNANGKKVDLTIVASLVNKASLTQVKEKFGEASDEVVSPNDALLLYKVDNKQYLFTFNAAKILTSFVLDNKSENEAAQLSYAAVKEARAFTKKDDIAKKLGEPTQATINNKEEVWYYKFGKDPSAEKVLIIEYDSTNSSIVKKYNYYADAHTSFVGSSDILSSFTKGVSGVDEIKKKLGEPTKVILSSQSEDWYYTSANTSLIVYFNNQSKLNDYFYEKKSNR